jgi:protein tyrosine/serine phosphatase
MTASGSESAPIQKPIKTRRSRRLAVIVIVLTLLAILALLSGVGVFGGNVRVIDPGRAYRSATLTGESYTGITARLAGNDLSSVLKRDHIRTVINLRGGSNADEWYREEVRLSERAGAAHRDISMSARSLPPPASLAALLDTFDHTKYPILIHCQAGADRTGLASTIYANLYERLPLDRAEAEELTWRYGHIPIGKTRAMDDFFDLYRSNSHGESLRDWILNRYPQVYAARAGANGVAH